MIKGSEHVHGSSILGVALLLMAAGCHRASLDEKEPAVIPAESFEGMPLTGNLATARNAGFTSCLDNTDRVLRCRKDGVRLMGIGPLAAAVDLDARAENGQPRFDHMTIWHESDQSKVLELRSKLLDGGWLSCLAANAEYYWQDGGKIEIAVDTSYWSTRRMIIKVRSAGATNPC